MPFSDENYNTCLTCGKETGWGYWSRYCNDCRRTRMVYTRCNGFRIRMLPDIIVGQKWAVDTKYGPALFTSFDEAVMWAVATTDDYKTDNLPRIFQR